MKRYLILVALLCVGLSAAAAAGPRAAEILRALSTRMQGMGSYGVTFSVEAGGRTTGGSYSVSGDNYYMQLGDAEVYSDGKVRYEVNNRTKEVTIDAVDTKSRNILNNPTRAFDLVGGEFTSELLWERDGQAAVRLTPKSTQGAMSVMTVTVSTQRAEPRSVVYDFDGERITISVQSVAAAKSAPKAFSRNAYAGYEIIDFR